MWKQIQRFRALGQPARGLFLRASVLLPLVSISLKWRGLRQTKALLERFISVSQGELNSEALERAALTARMVRAAGYYGIGHPNCLSVSLALWWLLARQGIASDLRLGVRKEGEKFEAHAWVECGGLPLNEPEAKHQQFAAFDAALASLPPEPR
jgi:hypothetical protein